MAANSSSVPILSVVLPTHNPHPKRLEATLGALATQTLPADLWETVIVDNRSNPKINPTQFASVAPSNSRLVFESALGLSTARRAGISSTAGKYLVFVDDDNVLAADYLEAVVDFFEQHPLVGAAGGKSIPRFESQPHPWHSEFLPLLALRDLGDTDLISAGLRPANATRNVYPGFAPIGAGMALRRSACESWLASDAVLSDRHGAELSSGGDNDIVFSVMKAGWEVAYSPRLSLHHLIPASRLDPVYLARLNRGIQKSWMQVLAVHDANPWAPLSHFGATLRKARSYLSHAAWRHPAAFIRWQGACGHFDGRVATRR